MDWYEQTQTELKDKEGIDIQKQLISHSKVQKKKERSEEDYQGF